MTAQGVIVQIHVANSDLKGKRKLADERVAGCAVISHASWFETHSEDASMYQNEATGDLFAQSAILPVQFYDKRSKEFEGERRLMLALLTDAVHCYQAGIASTAAERSSLFKEAERWLFSRRRNMPFAFEDVCGVLDIDPAYFRSGLLRWSERRLIDSRLKLIRRTPVVGRRPTRYRKSGTTAARRPMALA
jgi:hypothetical protein